MNDYQVLQQLRYTVEIMRREHHEMDEDEKCFVDMIEGGTNAFELICEWVRQYFDKKAVAEALYERASLIERQADARKTWIRLARNIGHITGTQHFPEGTVFETKSRDELIYDPTQVPDEYKKVDEIALRKATKNGLTDIARLVPSNKPPTLTIRTK